MTRRGFFARVGAAVVGPTLVVSVRMMHGFELTVMPCNDWIDDWRCLPSQYFKKGEILELSSTIISPEYPGTERSFTVQADVSKADRL